MPLKLTQEQIGRRMSLYRQGLSDAEIGEIVGRDRSSIRTWRTRRGIYHRKGRGRIALTPEEEARRWQLYWRGLNDTEIGREIGRTRATIGQWRISRGLPLNYTRKGPLTENEKTIIRMLHGFDLTIRDIANTIKRSSPTVLKFCHKEGLDTSISRGQQIKASKPRDAILRYLEENGPTMLRELVVLKILSDGGISSIQREADLVERFRFKGGSWLFGDISSKMVYFLRDDPRIIDFVAERVVIAPTTPTEAGRITRVLGEQLGRERAREIVRQLGYQYGHERSESRDVSHRKFSDREFRALYNLKLNDTQIAKLFRVSPATVRARRKKLGLPSHFRRKHR